MKVFEVFLRFLLMGCVSFGGPAAHIAYFHNTFVENLKWVAAGRYAQLVAISQFLPGPSSSQVGFAIGLHRAGLAGGIAAFLGFTSPSFLLMYWFAVNIINITQIGNVTYFIYILKLLAVVVVTDAVMSMAKSFLTTPTYGLIAVLSATLALISPLETTPLFIVMGSALIGLVSTQLLQQDQQEEAEAALNIYPLKRWKIVSSLIIFVLLALLLFLFSECSPEIALFSEFFNVGSLVFGGGHVVLPMMQHILDGALSTDTLLTGYAAAQAVPGPMFTLASFYGALLLAEPMTGALIATLAIFLPGFLLLYACEESWNTLSRNQRLLGALTGVNSAVVGLLAATLIDPIIITAIEGPGSIIFCALSLLILRRLKPPIYLLVLVFLLIGFVGTFI